MEEDLNALPITEWEEFFSLDTCNSTMSHGRLQGSLPSSWTHRVITAEKTQTCGATGQGIIRQENDILHNTVNVKSWALRHVNAVIKQGVAV